MASEQILDIGAAKQLFVDERIIAEAKDLECTLNHRPLLTDPGRGIRGAGTADGGEAEVVAIRAGDEIFITVGSD